LGETGALFTSTAKPVWANTHNASINRKENQKWIAKEKQKRPPKPGSRDRHTQPETNPNDSDDYLTHFEPR